MKTTLFRNDMERTRQIILWCTLLLFVLALSASLMLYFGGKPLFWGVEVITALGLVIFLLTLAFLRLNYLGKPEVREKYHLKRNLSKIQKGLQDAQSSLAEALQNGESVRQKSQEQQAAERLKFDGLSKEIENRIAELKIAKDKELTAGLAQLQSAYLETGLKDNQLDPTDIPGLGVVLIEKLNTAGIHTAYDVTSETIQAIPGFGESKALSLVRWRESVERNLRENQPQALPDEQRLGIEDKYSAQILRLQDENTAAQTTYEDALQKLQIKESQDLTSAVVQETSARQQLNDLEAQKQDIQEKMGKFSQITFPRMLIAALIKDQVNWQKRVLAFLALFGYVVFGLANGIILIATLISARLF
jgi:hypothetical protein